MMLLCYIVVITRLCFCIFQNMRKQLLTALILGLAEAIFISENVIFHKTNEISITRAKWLATFIIDLRPFRQFLAKLQNDLYLASVTAECIVKEYDRPNKTEYFTTFQSLQKELNFLNGTHEHLMTGLLDYKLLHTRQKRAPFNFIGDIGSFLFGLVTEDEIKSIRKNIASLAQNQEQIIHVVEDSITVLNMTRAEVSENRQAIMELVRSIHGLDSKLATIADALQKQIYENKYFLEMYFQLDLIINELKDMLQNGLFYLENLKTQLNFLSLGRLSMSSISPRNLRQLLSEIKSKLPTTLSLIGDPAKDLFLFYRQLASSALLEDDRIIIVLSIPVLHTSNRFEVFKAHSLPLAIKGVKTDNNHAPDMIATYDLEAHGLMIDQGRTKYALLTKDEIDQCSDPSIKWCSVTEPIFPVNLAKLCLVHLFLKNSESIQKYCKRMVTLNTKLPMGVHLYDSVWAIASKTELQFSLVCEQSSSETRTTKPPVHLLQIPASCIASNLYMTLSSSYETNSEFDLVDSNLGLLKHINFSQALLWSPFLESLPNMTTVTLPKHLRDIPRIPLQHLIDKLHYMQKVNMKSSSWPIWTYFWIALAIILLVIAGYLLYKRCKGKVLCLCSAIKLRGCRRDAGDTEQPCTTAGPTTVEGLQLAEDGQNPSCPSHSQGEVEMVKRLYPMLFHGDVTGRESLAAETSTRL